MKTINLFSKYGVGKFLKVSDEDFDFVSSLNLYISNRGYAKTYYQGKHWPLHQLIDRRAGAYSKYLDHKNQDKIDNQRENLRPATTKQNNANVNPRASSGFKGVYRKRGSNWTAEISVDGKTVALGTFENPHHAALVYDLWA